MSPCDQASSGNIWSWRKDVWFLVDLWGVEPDRINLGVGYYSRVASQTGVEETAWATLSPTCPATPYESNDCNGTPFVGKKMNCLIGKFARSRGLGGLFPWELSYDSYSHNNTLASFLLRGWETGHC